MTRQLVYPFKLIKDEISEHFVEAGTCHKRYIPEGVLESVLIETRIREIIRRCNFGTSDEEQMADAIIKGGRKTLAILIYIEAIEFIKGFIYRENLSDGKTLDGLLPLEKDRVKALLLDNQDTAATFFRAQWAFISPVFAKTDTHNHFSPETIFPFKLDKERPRQGANSRVFDTLVDHRHLRYWDQETNRLVSKRQEDSPFKLKDVWVVRKEIELMSNPEAREELHAHRYANQKGHSSILQLVASYEVDTKLYLLTPK